MKLSHFDYNLPKELIAQYPIKKRTSSRLLAVDRKSRKICDEKFCNFINYLNKGDCLILNDTKVIPSRLIGEKEATKGKVDILLLERKGSGIYSCLSKSNHPLKNGTKIIFDKGLYGIFRKKPDGFNVIEFNKNGLQGLLKRDGLMPLPPYIKRHPDDIDKTRYQTIFAKNYGAVASPTAGLHFTKAFLRKIAQKGIKIAYVTLHVNYATFNPVKTEDIRDHNMHSEYFILPKKTADIINQAKKRGGKVVAVGTTTVRVLETTVAKHGSGWTKLFIYPPYKFKVADMMLTNFHMPKTTLLMLVDAFIKQSMVHSPQSIEKDLLFKAYRHAIEKRYRFLSYGDAMLIV